MLEPSLLHVPVIIRPTALISGTLAALVTAAVTRNNRAVLSVSAGVLWYAADCTHVVGHIISSQAVAAPIDAVEFGIYPKNIYHNNTVSPQQHIGRSIGGLIASFGSAMLFVLLARLLPHRLGKKLFIIAAIENALVFSAAMLPIPIVDGGVILTNLRKMNA